MNHLLLPVLVGTMMIVMLVLFLWERICNRGRKIPVERSYHENRFFLEEDLTEYQAIAPAGLFFRWCALRGFLSNEYENDPLKQMAIGSVCRGVMSGSDYLLQYNGGNLTARDLNEEGNAFAAAYFEDDFWDDLEELTGREPLDFVESDIDYSAVANHIDGRYREWKSKRDPASA